MLNLLKAKKIRSAKNAYKLHEYVRSCERVELSVKKNKYHIEYDRPTIRAQFVFFDDIDYLSILVCDTALIFIGYLNKKTKSIKIINEKNLNMFEKCDEIFPFINGKIKNKQQKSWLDKVILAIKSARYQEWQNPINYGFSKNHLRRRKI